LDLNGACPYSITQNVKLVAGADYQLRFRVNRNPLCDDKGIPKTGTVIVTGGQLQTFDAKYFDLPC